MNAHDQINAVFEFCAIFMILNHCYVLYKDKKVRGVSVLSSIFFTTWSFWNTYYYPNINQMWSFYACVCVALAQCFYVWLIFHYRRLEKRGVVYH